MRASSAFFGTARSRGHALVNLEPTPFLPRLEVLSMENDWYSWSGFKAPGSIDDEEHTLGMRCVAAPIYNEHAEVLGAISLAGPSSRLPDERIKQLGPLVAHTAEELTHRLGGRWPLGR